MKFTKADANEANNNSVYGGLKVRKNIQQMCISGLKPKREESKPVRYIQRDCKHMQFVRAAPMK